MSTIYNVSDLTAYAPQGITLLDIAQLAGGRTRVNEAEAEKLIQLCEERVVTYNTLKQYSQEILLASDAPHHNKQPENEYVYLGHRITDTLFLRAIPVHRSAETPFMHVIPACVIDPMGLLVFHLSRIEKDGKKLWLCRPHPAGAILYGYIFSPGPMFKVPVVAI